MRANLAESAGVDPADHRDGPDRHRGDPRHPDLIAGLGVPVADEAGVPPSSSASRGTAESPPPDFYGNYVLSQGSRQSQELARGGRPGAGAGPGKLWLVEVKQVVGRH